MATLQSPDDPESLYRYRAADVPRARPLVQGDVFDGVSIPGVDDGGGLAIVLTHACTMRRGSVLRERVTMARVRDRDQPIALPWKGNYAVMPLPNLRGVGGDLGWHAAFDDVGTVATASLALEQRIACLDDFAIALLNQRHAHHLTRYIVEAELLYEQSANVLVEADLLEEWIEAGVSADVEDWNQSAGAAAEEFDQFLTPSRDDLKLAAKRASVRRSVMQEIQRRFEAR